MSTSTAQTELAASQAALADIATKLGGAATDMAALNALIADMSTDVTSVGSDIAAALGIINTPTPSGLVLPAPPALQSLDLNLVLNDQFDADTGLDASIWTAVNWGGNLTSNVSIVNGQLVLEAPASGSMARVSSDPVFGSSKGLMLPMGCIIEWDVVMPPAGVWAALWLTSDNAAWPAGGEEDYLEGGSGASVYTTNYHDSAGATNAIVTWPAALAGVRHTITARRALGAGDYQVYDNAVMRGQWTGGDNDGPQAITMSIGTTSAATFPAKMLVNSVKAWELA